MARPPHVDQDRIDDAIATALAAVEQPVNTGRIVKACETMEEALAELKYFNEPANLTDMGRLEALDFAWRNDRLFRWSVLVWQNLCLLMSIPPLMVEPWRTGILHAMQNFGMSGLILGLFGAAGLCSSRTGYPAYAVKTGPLLLTVGAGFIALSLLGMWLA